MGPAPVIDPGASVFDVPLVCLDTETTGVHPSSRLLEVGAVKSVGGAVEDEFEAFCNPGCAIPPDATEVHGLTSADLDGTPPAPEMLQSFFEWAGDAVFVAHHAPFDVGIIAFELARADLRPPEGQVLDTSLIPRKIFPLLSYSLGSLVEHLDLPRSPQDHRALPDAFHVFHVLHACFDACPEPPTLAQMLDMNGTPLTFRGYRVPPPEVPEALICLEEARLEERDVAISYGEDKANALAVRVRPQFLYRDRGHDWLEGRSEASGLVETWRLDRIISAEPR